MQHTYPSKYPPGTHWAIDAAWEILDSIEPGIMSDDIRAFLAGQIAGRLMQERANQRTRQAGHREAPEPVAHVVTDCSSALLRTRGQ